MPEISRFYGIVVKMFHNDHHPPHFHAKYGNDRMIVNIGPGSNQGNTSATMCGRQRRRKGLWRNYLAQRTAAAPAARVLPSSLTN